MFKLILEPLQSWLLKCCISGNATTMFQMPWLSLMKLPSQLWRNIFLQEMLQRQFYIFFTYGRLFQIQSGIQLKEFPGKNCCFRKWKNRILQIACWLHSLLDCLETAESAKVDLISTEICGIHIPFATKRLTNSIFVCEQMCCRSFSTFGLACRWRMKVAFVIEASGKLVT